ncbi:hypothetical protein GCM10010182_71220 [Actinomadura cremea]|nr:hypothetical protein GCM10010182_71220 [Actinomadura cremea]
MHRRRQHRTRLLRRPADRYLEGLIPTSPATPLHPNAKGMAVFGAAVADAAR